MLTCLAKNPLVESWTKIFILEFSILLIFKLLSAKYTLVARCSTNSFGFNIYILKSYYNWQIFSPKYAIQQNILFLHFEVWYQHSLLCTLNHPKDMRRRVPKMLLTLAEHDLKQRLWYNLCIYYNFIYYWKIQNKYIFKWILNPKSRSWVISSWKFDQSKISENPGT